MVKEFDRKLILEDGSEYLGYGFGYDAQNAVCELVFNTNMAGYHDILADPSYANQIVVMTYPLIGNYGIADDDYDTTSLAIGGIVARDYNDIPSNFLYTKTLSEAMKECHVPGIYGLDTRKITAYLRKNGLCRAIIANINLSKDEARKIFNETPERHDLVASVSNQKRRYFRTSNNKYNVVAIDCGIKSSVIRSLNLRGCNVTVVPYDTTAELVQSMSPDGVLISNGPGSPEDIPETIELVKQLKGKFPIFGLCLGHGVVCLAYGAKVFKLKAGHRGGNHPVRNLETGKIETSSQNHSYCVDAKSLENTNLEITHINILDNTVEGVRCKADKLISVQYHPESAPGADGSYLYDSFIDLMKGESENA